MVAIAAHDDRRRPIADQIVELVPQFLEDELGPAPHHLRPNEVLFEQGSRGSRIYMVDDGELDLVRVHPDGTEELLRTVGTGDYFGEMGPPFSLPRSATARANRDSVVTGYTSQDFRDRVGVDFVTGLL